MHTPRSRLTLAAALAATLASAATAQKNAGEAWLAFQRLPPARQQQATAAVVDGLPDHPIAAALRKLTVAAVPPHERAKLRPAQHASRSIDFPHDAEVLPQRAAYVFGVGIVEPLGQKHGGAAKPSSRPAPKADPVVLRQALLGCVPDADTALAALLQRLDTDTRADSFAAFLHSWRNIDESFYEGLDRTAGTKESLFFFDAMLSDFRSQFGGDGELALKGGLQAAHDALHEAFLAYRQYRGFREAVAWSLVLPPDARLPSRLARYEERVEGSYSLRQQVVMVSKALDHDLDALVESIVADAPPLPQPVWSKGYDPYPPWAARFQKLQATMIERSGTTDAFLAAAEAERRELAAKLAELAAEQARLAASEGKAK